MVVERGVARCPRCVSMADYVFIEGDPEPGEMRYEVRCRKCGERYEEDLRPKGGELVRVEPSITWPPDQEPVPPRDWGAELRGRVEQLREHAEQVREHAEHVREHAGQIRGRASQAYGQAANRASAAARKRVAEVDEAVRRARALVPKRRFGQLADQTGG